MGRISASGKHGRVHIALLARLSSRPVPSLVSFVFREPCRARPPAQPFSCRRNLRDTSLGLARAARHSGKNNRGVIKYFTHSRHQRMYNGSPSTPPWWHTYIAMHLATARVSIPPSSSFAFSLHRDQIDCNFKPRSHAMSDVSFFLSSIYIAFIHFSSSRHFYSFIKILI